MPSAMSAAITTATMMIPRRRVRGASISVSAGVSFCCGNLDGSATLLSSYVFLVVLPVAQRACQTQLGDVKAVQAGHILTLGLGKGLLCLTDGQIVTYTVRVAFLRFFERFTGERSAGLGNLNLLLRGGDVEQSIAHVGLDLRLLI